MLNFRKLKQDFSSNVLAEGRAIYEEKKVLSAKIIRIDGDSIRLSGKIMGKFDNSYESEMEIDRAESELIHSNCDCSYRYDCVHLAAMIFFLEKELDAILIQYSKENDIRKDETIEEEKKDELLKTIQEAKTKEEVKKDLSYQKEVLEEYVTASSFLAASPFFLPEEKREAFKAELFCVLNPKTLGREKVEFQLVLRLPNRSKPLQVPNLQQFFTALKDHEALHLGAKRYDFSLECFEGASKEIIAFLMERAVFPENKNEKTLKVAAIDYENFGILLAKLYEFSLKERGFNSEDLPVLPSLYSGSLETPLHGSYAPATFRFELEYLGPPASKILIKPSLVVEQTIVPLSDVVLLECQRPGVIYKEVYYPFPGHIRKMHLRHLAFLREKIIPEPLFGTFFENALSELKRYGEVVKEEVLEHFVTLPFTKEMGVRCQLSYLDGELEASVFFSYEGIEVAANPENSSYKEIASFVREDGILARNLVEERRLLDELFQDFVFQNGLFITKSEKKIVEFMTEIVPKYQERITFECPQNLLDQFVYDETKFQLHLKESKEVGFYEIDLKVDGQLEGVKMDLLFECISSKRCFIELGQREGLSKILVLDLDKISKIVQIFDELGIKKLDKQKELKPIWTLVGIEDSLFKDLPIRFSMTEVLKEIRLQLLGEKAMEPSPIPKEVKADLRPYQTEGIYWLERLRRMYLNGILADDMGLGKTLEAIVAVTEFIKEHPKVASIVVCPTSLLYNWKEEVAKFNPKLRVLIIDGIPSVRQQLIAQIKDFDLIITSYSLMQKDIEFHKEITFGYAILDEAQHIKNRMTRNAKSVKQLHAAHRLILTGTPIENSLDELWSLFDFLMPSFLSGYDRFCEKYIRKTGDAYVKGMEFLKKKVAPFILRRMKADVLKELPPVTEITYHCHLLEMQEALYRSYAASAKEELTKLVAKEGFDRVRIHILATLTRLKQICCHPAIFAKENPECGDSAKYEMLLELLQGLVEGGHRTVIFSQYTKMLEIMREDFEKRGIRFSYLDGSTKNRLQIVKEFNENDIPVFLVSLKAGGTGLNITGADTVIHYDMWWNPAVENQATDRVHRIGQTKNVSAYKLVTLGSIEEKIVEMQKKKKGLVKKIVSCDDEAISKLTWAEVLELLQT